MPTREQAKQLFDAIMARARTDEAFKRQLLVDATAVMSAHGLSVPPGMKIQVVENTRNQWTFVLPTAESEALSDEELENVAGGPMPFLSDARLKADVRLMERVLEGPARGLGLYRYRYLWSDTVFVGVMAQEVAEVLPEAVALADNGYLAVDYAQLGLRLMSYAQWTAANLAHAA